MDKNYGALGPVCPKVFLCVRKNRTREAERDFYGLPIRRDEERVVDPPLVFKRVFFSGDERRALDRENWMRARRKRKEDRDWSGKEGKTLEN
ncbi:hypothetical protein TNCV_4681011 [Trichonephila clavipes]|nr:hypothetical protein TNCV_4681011 [Trichonephila clavipes]